MKDNFDEITKDMWRFDIHDYIPGKVDPVLYFKTSGDAVMKAKRLMYDSLIMYCRARKLHDMLSQMKGEAKFLEFKFREPNIPTLQHKDPKYKRKYANINGKWRKIAVIFDAQNKKIIKDVKTKEIMEVDNCVVMVDKKPGKE